MVERCPTCNQQIKHTERVRVCRKCGEPIIQHHKYKFVTEDGATWLEHRDCDNPFNYLKANPPADNGTRARKVSS